MNTEILNLRPFVAEMELKENHEMFKDIIVLDYGVKKQGSEKMCQVKFTHEDENDMFKTAVSSCGCTTPKITDIKTEVNVQVLDVGYDTKRLGKFEKQVTLYTKDKVRKQIIKVQGEIVV